MLNKVIPVLDKGFVSLLNIMPHPSMGIDLDSYVVQMARTSFLGSSKGYDADMKLLRYLIENKHLSPFEGCEMTFHVKAPIFVARQWFRHRTASYNEQSYRYTKAEESDFYIPSEWRLQSENNKQASDGVVDSETNELLTRYYKHEVESAWKTYEFLLSKGVAREQARAVLPVSLYTTFNYKTDLRNLIWGFLEQRCHPHAQAEIRAYALVIRDIVKYYMPRTMEIIGEQTK